MALQVCRVCCSHSSLQVTAVAKPLQLFGHCMDRHAATAEPPGVPTSEPEGMPSTKRTKLHPTDAFEHTSEESGGAPVTRFKGGRMLRGGVLVAADVWVREGRIVDPQKLFYEERRAPDRVVDCHGLILAPGFIDLQINGAFGVDFSSMECGVGVGLGRVLVCGVGEGLERVAQGLLQHGVTSFCPTIVTSPVDYYHKVLPAVRGYQGRLDQASILGVHCEGPFINSKKKGAHEEAYVQESPSPTALQRCYGSTDGVSIVTLAPELPGAMEGIRWLSGERGVVVSLGHSMAQLKVAEEAVRGGASLITHLFNAMLPFHHRDPGIVGLLTSQRLDQRQAYFSIIADSYHTHDTVLRIAYKAHPRGVVLVTDAMCAMGLGAGSHSLGNMQVEVANGVARLEGTSTLAGSVATMDFCVRHFKEATGCTTEEALEAASLHPAQVLGQEGHKGTLEFGSDADLVLLDQDLHVQATFIAGQRVWRAPQGTIT